MAEADPADRRTGRTTLRVHDFVNRGPEFDWIYIYPPLLYCCWQILRQPFKLSMMMGRTLLPCMPAQEFHVDYPPGPLGATMVGFIVMIDDFHTENGATCFLRGSHLPSIVSSADGRVVPAWGAAGSMVVYNGSVWHGHGANTTAAPRRSVQGAFLRRDAPAHLDFSARMRPETLERISPLAKVVLGL